MRSTFALVIFSIALAIFSTAVYAENHTQADPCAGVTCSSPPAAECDGSNVKTYSSGTCSNGQCTYSSSSTSCRFGCSLGQCKPCEPSACGTNSKTCPDGFASTCQQSCSGDSCVACEPSCAGHETAPASTNSSTSSGVGGGGGSSNTSGSGDTSSNTDPCANVVCNSPPQNSCDGNFVRIFSSPGACNNGQCSYPETGYACANGCYSGSCILTANTSCPVIPLPACAGSALIEEKDNMGCIVRYICKTDQVCGNKVCEPGESQCAPSSCRTGEDCRTTCTRDCGSAYCPEDCSQNRCPSGCDCRFGEHGELLSSFCQSEQRCDNNNVCDKGEDQSCRDCIGAECPLNRPCPDGSSVKYERSERGWNCDPSRLEEIPSDCRQETDQSGLIRVVCDRQRECPPVPQDARLKCSDEGGIPRFNKDHSGCKVSQCDFGGERGSGPVFAGRANCPSPEAVIESLEKCRDLGLPGVIGFEGGCKIGKCQQREERHECPNPTEPEKMEMEKKCREEGQQLVFQFDGQCNQPKCGQRRGSQCERDLPKEAYDGCAAGGGQLVGR